MNKLFCFLFLLLISFSGFGQTKYEKEFRMKKKDVPEKALHFINSLNFSKKIKWYKEIGLDKTSIEAKTKHKGKRYSIEFKPDGTLEDIEIEIQWRKIPENMRRSITKLLKAEHKKYSIGKVQIQYVSKKEFLASRSSKATAFKTTNFNYEIVLSARVAKTYKMYEYLISGSGELLDKLEIVLHYNDNIEY